MVEADVERDCSLSAVLSLVLTPQLIHRLPQQLHEVAGAVRAPHLLVQLRHEPTTQPLAVVQEPRRHVVPLVPPLPLPRPHPVRRRVPAPEPDEVRHALHQPPRRTPAPVPLPHVRRLVEQHARDLSPHVAGVSRDVVGADVDLVIDGVGHAWHGVDEEGDGVDGLPVGWSGLVEGAPDEVGGGVECLGGVLCADFVGEPGAAGRGGGVVGHGVGDLCPNLVRQQESGHGQEEEHDEAELVHGD
uniref:Uncharacterized protein n=1 Tax=Kalanchoe fedtschenkoi TaxID=63787 RepID=A0A7N0TN05_KALFE